MVKRRAFLGGMGSLLAARAAAAPAPVSTSGLPPRKVIVGTMVQPFWGEHPGVEKRAAELTAAIDRMQAEARGRYGRGIDLAVLPEVALSGDAGRNLLSRAVHFDGAVRESFARKAREHRCYIVVPTYLRESREGNACSNAAVLVGRNGETAGVYRKVHLVVSGDFKTMEGGCTPGREVPVFHCDFGRLGIQICYDMEFDRGWRELAQRGAELVAWPTQSPQTAQPAFRAKEQRCYIVSSTWRNNASVFEPTGKIVAQARPPAQVLVQEIDLSYAILPWSAKLRNGKALAERYGDRAGFRYYEDEDCGIFWSNDPATPVGKMIQDLGFVEAHEELEKVRRFYARERVLDYR